MDLVGILAGVYLHLDPVVARSHRFLQLMVVVDPVTGMVPCYRSGCLALGNQTTMVARVDVARSDRLVGGHRGWHVGVGTCLVVLIAFAVDPVGGPLDLWPSNEDALVAPMVMAADNRVALLGIRLDCLAYSILVVGFPSDSSSRDRLVDVVAESHQVEHRFREVLLLPSVDLHPVLRVRDLGLLLQSSVPRYHDSISYHPTRAF